MVAALRRLIGNGFVLAWNQALSLKRKTAVLEFCFR
jgi:hypothetical protein